MGTPNGTLIRGQIPTTYDPDNEPLPLPGAPTGLSAGPGDAAGKINVVWLPVTNAASYTVTVINPGGSPETSTFGASTNTLEIPDLPSSATVEVTVFATNATGNGPLSASVTVTVPS